MLEGGGGGGGGQMFDVRLLATQANGCVYEKWERGSWEDY